MARNGESRSAFVGCELLQGIEQRPEPRLVRTPAADRARIQGLPHLVFAQRPHRATGFMEVVAALVPCEPAEFHQSARLCREIRHQRLVLHLKNGVRRKNLVPVRHQPVISLMEAPKFAKVVGEVQTARKQLAITREASVARIAPHMNDARLRQGEMDQSQMIAVRRQFVGDAFGFRRQRGDAHRIRAAQTQQPIAAKLRKADGVILTAKSGIEEVLKNGQLARSEHVGVAGQNLLNQARSRARHTHHEDRQVGGMSFAGMRSESCRRVGRFDLAEQGEDLRFRIGHKPAIEPVAYFKLREGRRSLPQLVIGLEQCEMEFGLLPFVEAIFLAQQGFERRKARIVRPEGCRLRQRAVIGRLVRRKLHRSRKRLLGFAEMSELLEDRPQAELRLCILRFAGQDAFIDALGLVLPAGRGQRLGKAEQRALVGGHFRQNGFETADGILSAPGPQAKLSQSVQRVRVAGTQLQRGAKMPFGLVEPPRLHEPHRSLAVLPDGIVHGDLGFRLRRAIHYIPVAARVAPGGLFFFPGRGVAITVVPGLTRSSFMPHWLRLPAVALLIVPLLSGCQAELKHELNRSAEPVLPAAPPLALIPEPAKIEAHAGAFALSDATRLVCPPADASCEWTAGYLAQLLSRTRGLSLKTASGEAAPNAIVFRRTAGEPDSEAYSLEVEPQRIVISASGDAGLLYGAVTLWQLATQDEAPQVVIRAVSIEDRPRFAWRGILLDSSRHFQSPQFVKSFIDTMALHKLNVLHWHLTDDQGWRLQIKRYPKLTSVGAWRRIPGQSGLYGGFYSQSQIRDIVAYARQRNVTIVPEIEMPGHSLAAIVAYPKLASVAHPPRRVSSDWGIFPYLYNTDDASFAFLKNVLSEVMALFPSRYIHVGGDEAATDQWNSSPRVRHQMRARHIKDMEALQSYYFARIGKFLDAHGRRLIGWDEILNAKLEPKAAITSWHSSEGAIEAVRLGHDVVLAPSNALYFNNCQTDAAGEPPCRGNILTLKEVYNFDPAPPNLKAEEISHFIGVEACIWTEQIPRDELVSYAAFPRAAALAEIAWSPAARHDWQNFLQRLPAQMGRYRALGVVHSESALSVRIEAQADVAGARVSLSNQTGLGEIHYALDGSVPTTASPLYTAPFTTALPSNVFAAPFLNEHALTAPARERIDTLSLLRRTSYAMKPCSNDLPLSLAGGAKADGSHAMFMVNVMNPCWIYQQADLSQIGSIEVTAGRLPFNFQIGKDIRMIPLTPPRTPDGELDVHLDSCQGQRVASLPLSPAAAGGGLTTLRATIAPHQGVHDLCFIFTRRSVDPIWAIDEVQLLPAAQPE